MMLKKFLFRILAVALVFATSAAFAGGPDVPPPPEYFEGFYAGVGLGLSVNTYDFNSHLLVPKFVEKQEEARVKSTHGLGFNAGRAEEDFAAELHVGYDFKVGDWFLIGLLLGVNFTTDQDNENGARVSSYSFAQYEDFFKHAKRLLNVAHLETTEWTIDLHPGFLLNPKSLLYLVVGVAFNCVNYNVDGWFNRTSENDNNVVSRHIHAHVDQSIEGLRVGMGMKEMIGENLALFLQYVYTTYGNASTWVQQDFRKMKFRKRRHGGPSEGPGGPGDEPTGPGDEPTGPGDEPTGPGDEPGGPGYGDGDDNGGHHGDRGKRRKRRKEQMVVNGKVSPDRHIVLFGADWYFNS